jgi:hypothetical protein
MSDISSTTDKKSVESDLKRWLFFSSAGQLKKSKVLAMLR